MEQVLAEVFESQHKVNFNGLVLLDYTDYLIGGPSLNFHSVKERQHEGFVSSAGKKAFDRGNMGTEVRIRMARVFASTLLALRAQANALTETPGGTHDLTIEVAGSVGALTVRNCVVQCPRADVHKGTEVLVEYEWSILGGEVTGSLFTDGDPLS